MLGEARAIISEGKQNRSFGPVLPREFSRWSLRQFILHDMVEALLLQMGLTGTEEKEPDSQQAFADESSLDLNQTGCEF